MQFNSCKKLFYTQEEIQDISSFIAIKLNNVVGYISIEDHKMFINKISGKASMEELRFALAMELQGIEFEYNTRKLAMLPSFKTKYKSYKEMNYTPDFTLKIDNRLILVEIKGFIIQDKSLHYKIYDFIISQKYPEYDYCILKWAGTLKEKDQELYLYHQNVKRKAISKKNRTSNNFYTWLKINKKTNSY